MVSSRDRRRLYALLTLGCLWALGSVLLSGCGRQSTGIPDDSRKETPPSSLRGNVPMPVPALPQQPEQPPSLSRLAFHDVAEEHGLHYEWPRQQRPITALHSFGSGCAAFDGDKDGWQDVLLVCDPHPRLFRNHAGLRFEEVTSASGLSALDGDWMGCAAGDYDGDGLLDLLLTGYHQLALCRNVGGLTFEVTTEAAGLDPSNDGQWASSAAFMDLDGDRWLDLVVLNYVVYGPDSKQYCELRPGVLSGCNPRETYPPERGRIWRNTGSGRFQPVPQSQGMDDTHGMGLVLAFIDLDEDGRTDFYIGNDGTPAELMHNRGDMRFENIALVAGVDIADRGAAAAMGSDWADYDGDGVPDLVVSNWQGLGAVLFRGMGSLLFLNRSQASRVTRATAHRMGFGAKWVDFENDGWPDLCFVNGHVYDNSAEIDGPNAPFRQSINLLSNDHGKRFVERVMEQEPDVQRAMMGRGSASLDFDNDGRMDLLAVDFEGPVMLLQNKTESANHWLKLDLRGRAPNVFAYGARVMGKAGDRIWRSEVSPASSYLSSSDPRIHWGLQDAATLDSLTIHWPSGDEQTLTDVAADQILNIVEPE